MIVRPLAGVICWGALMLAINLGCARREEAAGTKTAAADIVQIEKVAGKQSVPKPPAGEFPAQAVTVDGEARVYRLVVPGTLDLTKPAPLVVAFHGMLIDSKDVMPKYTRLNDAAKKHGFLLAYPEAIGKSWGITPAKVNKDLAFFDALVKDVQRSYPVDGKRIYVLGMSNGGYFAQLVAKERSTMIAAAATHSGPLGLQTLFGIRAQRKFPVLIIIGDQDAIFSVKTFRENRDKYRGEGHEVQYAEVPGLNHFWAADANETIWRFFAGHPLDTKD